MADEDETPQCKVTYLDVPEGEEGAETNWIKRAGKARVVYTNEHVFEGHFNNDKIKHGYGVYTWMGKVSDDEDAETVEKAKFEGEYKDGMKTGYGKMKYPNGDVYDGEWFEDKMQGEGTYTYDKTKDIYTGSWYAGKKHGQGSYKFMADESVMTGTWENGQILTGQWILKDYAVYTGGFKMGRPFGPGKFEFKNSGLVQTGSYTVMAKKEDEEDEGDDDGPKPPKVEWKGDSIVSFSPNQMLTAGGK